MAVVGYYTRLDDLVFGVLYEYSGLKGYQEPWGLVYIHRGIQKSSGRKTGLKHQTQVLKEKFKKNGCS